MLFRRFSFKVVFRVGLLLLTLCTFAFIFGREDLLFNQIILAGIISAQVYELIRFVSKTNYELSKFLMAIQYADYSVNYKKSGLGASFEALNQALFNLLDTIKEAKIQKEAQYQFLKMMVDKISIGIISLKENNEIYLINKEAKRLLKAGELKCWNDLEVVHPALTNSVENAGSYHNQLVTLNNGEQLSVGVSAMVLIGHRYKLIIIQNIEREMEQKEMESWNKLIRVLTHEIMNSVTPITSLTDSLLRLLESHNDQKKTAEQLSSEDINDIRFSLQTIQRRSDGMLQFVDNYRKLTKIPKPEPEKILLKSLLESIITLMKIEAEKKGIRFNLNLSNPDQTINADRKLIEQVLINIITNSIHALEGKQNGAINISVSTHKYQKMITIHDNGKGIDKVKLESIFIPFYSTKTNGSGIGLSLSKQIMTLHNGTIKVTSHPEEGTSFTLVFNG